MKRILLLQLRRTFLSRSFVVYLATAVLFSWASVYFVQSIAGSASVLSEDMLTSLRQGDSYNFLMLRITSREELEHPHWKSLLTCLLGSSTMAMLLSVCVCRSITEEFRYGGFFTAAAHGCSRGSIFAAYQISMVLLTGVLSLVYTLTFAAVAASSGMPSGTFPPVQLVQTLTMQTCMLMSYAIFCTTLSVLVQKQIAAVLISLSVAAALPACFTYLRMLYDVDFPFESIWVLSRLSRLTQMPSAADALSALGLAAVSLLAGAAILQRIRIKHE